MSLRLITKKGPSTIPKTRGDNMAITIMAEIEARLKRLEDATGALRVPNETVKLWDTVAALTVRLERLEKSTQTLSDEIVELSR